MTAGTRRGSFFRSFLACRLGMKKGALMPPETLHAEVDSPTGRDYPRIVVPPPGPNARALIDRDSQWASTSYIKEYPLVVSRGSGAMIEDVDGNRYLDFMAGIAVASTGHAHPKVVAAIQETASRFLHICGTDFYYEGMAAFCERLAALGRGRA